MLKKSLFLFLAVFITTNLFSQDVTPSGAFTYTYPIEIPDGINGIQPNISLTYNSQAGNGIAGMGWILNGFPTITRDTTYPINWNNNDHFIYNGQRLIKENKPNNIYHTENISYEKIEYNGNYWVVTQKNGTKMFFGATSDSKIEAVGKSAARVWALNKVIDVNGNYYTVEYLEDTQNGDYYPKSVKYTSNDLNNYQGINEVVLYYEDRQDHYSIYNPSFVNLKKRLHRIDTIKNNIIINKHRLEYSYDISTQHSIITKIFSTNREGYVKSIKFNWSKGNRSFSGGYLTGPAGYNENQLFVADFNGDGKDDLGMVATNGWHSVQISNGTKFVSQKAYKIGTGYNTVIGDFNGDGITDFGAYASNGNFWLIKSTKTGFVGQHSKGPTGYDQKRLFVGDFNGDGKDDLGMVATNGWHSVQISDGNKFTSQIAYQIGTGYSSIAGDFSGDGVTDFAAYASNGNYWLLRSTKTGFVGKHTKGPAGYNQHRLYVGDFNGDGKNDLGMVATNGWHSVQLSDGNKFTSQMAYQIGTGYKSTVGDFNGDGLMDFGAYASNGNYWLIRSTKTGFTGKHTKGPAGYNHNRLLVGDYNGDGKSDLGMVATNGWHSVQLSDGTSFKTQQAFQIGTGYTSLSGDFNGDGISEFGAYASNGHFWLIKSNNKKPAISSIVNDDNVTITPVYKSAWDKPGSISLKHRLYPYFSNKLRRKVLSSLTVNNGRGKSYVTSYDYYNGKIRTGFKYERKSLGFEWIEKKNPNGTSVKTYYYQEENDALFAGAIKRQEIYGRDGKLYNATEFKYTFKPIQGKSSNYHAINSIKKDYEYSYSFNGVNYSNWEELKKSQNVLKTRKSYFYDNDGNIIRTFDEGDLITKADDTLSVIKYAKNNSLYITIPYSVKKYNYPLNISTYGTLENLANLSEHKEMFYDNQNIGYVGNKGHLTKKVEFSGESDKNKYPDLETNFLYNKFGNILSISDLGNKTSRIEYDTIFKNRVKKKINALNQVVQEYEYDNVGRVKWEKDINDEYIWYFYDFKDRVTESHKGNSSGPLKLLSKKAYSDIISPNDYPKWIKEDILSPSVLDPNNYISSYTYFDNLGNKLQTKTEGLDESGRSIWLTVSYYSDMKSGISKVSEPYTEIDYIYNEPNWSSLKHTKEYIDAIGRPYKTQYSDGSFDYFKYGLKDKLSLSGVKNGEGSISYEVVNGITLSKYSYSKGMYNIADLDSFNTNSWVYKVETESSFNGSKVTETSIEGESNSLITYVDLLGRKKNYTDPNMGKWKYEYDNNGNLYRQIDAKGNIISYEYDQLNRVIKKNGANKVIYLYDGKESNDINAVSDFQTYGSDCLGKLTKLYYEDNFYSETYYFDNDKREYKVTKTIDGESRTIETTLDEVGRIQREKLPTNEIITYNYRNDSNLEGISSSLNRSYISNIKYNYLGKVKSFGLGNGSETVYSYNTKNQLIGLNINKDSSVIANMEFRYDEWGNIDFKSFSDSILKFNEEYTYDSFFRLETAKSTQNLYGYKSYAYDHFNNLKEKDGFKYKYRDAKNKPHAVSEIEDNFGNILKSYKYDDNGNVTYITGQSHLVIKAKAPIKTNIPATMELWIGNNKLEKTWLVTSIDYQDYTWSGIIPEDEDIDIIFTYDKNKMGIKPQLEIDYIIINGNTIQSESNSVIFDPGNNHIEKFDNLKVTQGKELLTSTGRLSVLIPNAAKSPYRNIEYDKENRVKVIKDNGDSNSTSFFYYDDNGQRIKKEEGDTVTYYFFDNYEEVYKVENTKEVFHKSISYYYANGQKIAYTESDGSINSTFYFHSDHLGSAVRITDQTGTIIQSIAYDPYGKVAWFSGKDSTNYTYTNQESDISGFMYYNVRYYDPTLGRFLQADTYLDGLNRYTYCGNNPIIYTDPTGNFAFIPVLVAAGIGAVIGGVTGAYVANEKGLEMWSSDWWAHVGVGAGIGLVAGATGGALASLTAGAGSAIAGAGTFSSGLINFGCGALAGGTGGFISNFGNTWAFGGEGIELFKGDFDEALQNGGWGALYGGVTAGLLNALGPLSSLLTENFDSIAGGIELITVPGLEDVASKSYNLGDLINVLKQFPILSEAGKYIATNSSVLFTGNLVQLTNIVVMSNPDVLNNDSSLPFVKDGIDYKLNNFTWLLKYSLWHKKTRDSIEEKDITLDTTIKTEWEIPY